MGLNILKKINDFFRVDVDRKSYAVSGRFYKEMHSQMLVLEPRIVFDGAIGSTEDSLSDLPDLSDFVEFVEENTIYTASLEEDLNGDTIYYNVISGGPHMDMFIVNDEERTLSSVDFLDFEAVQWMSVEVSTEDYNHTKSIFIAVENVPEPPDLGEDAIVEYLWEENEVFVTTVVAVDQDEPYVGAPEEREDYIPRIVYSIAGGEDSDFFTINDQTGELSFNTAPDYESLEHGNVYNVIVRAMEDGGEYLQDTQEIDVIILDAQESPVIYGGDIRYLEVLENEYFETDVNAWDPEGDPIVYSIASGEDSDFFTINDQTGELSFKIAPDYENPEHGNVYNVTVQASDVEFTDTQEINITVSNQYEPPVIEGEDQVDSCAFENTLFVRRVSVVPGSDGGFSYSIVGGEDSDLFTIGDQTGYLMFNTALDYESLESDKVFNVIVQVGSDIGALDTQEIMVTVVDIPESPVIDGGDIRYLEVLENKYFVTEVKASDSDGDSIVYSIVGGEDSDLFTINDQDGYLMFNTAPDYESLEHGNVYNVTVQASDGSLTDTQEIMVTVVDIPKSPVIDGGDIRYLEVSENEYFVTEVKASDSDGDSIVYSIVGGEDSDLLTINDQTGELSFKMAPDYESLEHGNVYNVIVRASDGSLTDTQEIEITVIDTEQEPPVIDGGENITIVLPENNTYIKTVKALDSDGDSIVYSIVGGEDSDLLTINDQTGELSFKMAPDYESLEHGNVYNVTVQASDGSLTDTQEINIIIEDANDFPVISGPEESAVSLYENIRHVKIVQATDQDGDSITYSIEGGEDENLFVIDRVTGSIWFKRFPDYENPQDSDEDNIYTLIVQARDDGGTDQQTVTVSLLDVINEGGIMSNAGNIDAQEEIPDSIDLDIGTVIIDAINEMDNYYIEGAEEEYVELSDRLTDYSLYEFVEEGYAEPYDRLADYSLDELIAEPDIYNSFYSQIETAGKKGIISEGEKLFKSLVK